MLDEATLQRPDYPAAEEALLLKDAQRIAGLLQRSLDSRVLLNLSMPGVLKPACSMLVGIDRSHQRLQLDAPPAARAPQPGTSLRIGARLDGARFEFVSDFVDADRFRWIVALPAEALYLQRRSTFRLRVTRLPGIIGTHFFDHSQRFRGQLIDISALGLCARLSPGSDVLVGANMECVIDLHDSHVSCRAEVRWRRRSSAGIEIGILFEDLAPPQQQRLTFAIAALQRQLLRRAA